MEPFRCIHVSHLALDHQLHVAGEFDPAVQKIVADATLTAFDRVIDEALRRAIDCLLISGNCLEPGDRGLRGPAALVRGIARLAERDTAVILHSSPPVWSTWPAGLRWPPHAHRLGGGFESGVSITREGKLLATVTAARIDERHAGWQIRLPEMDGDGRTFHLNDDPGPIIGLHAAQTGSYGCTVVEIDAATGPQTSFVPVAPVRWERCTVTAAADCTRDDLLQELASQLEQAPRHTGEQVRLVTWIVSGNGALFDRLARPDFRNAFLDELTLLDPLPGVTVRTHQFKLRALLKTDDQEAPTDDVASEVFARLDGRFAHPTTSWRGCLPGPALHGGPWETKLDSLIGELDAEDLASEARCLALRWFAAAEKSEEYLSS
jgi:hypothetical protein